MPYSSSNMSLMRFAFTGSPTSSGTMCVTEGMTGSPASANSAFSFAAAACWLSRSTDEPFKRSEEHTSELQSLMRISYAVFCLKKKKHTTDITQHKAHKHTN